MSSTNDQGFLGGVGSTNNQGSAGGAFVGKDGANFSSGQSSSAAAFMSGMGQSPSQSGSALAAGLAQGQQGGFSNKGQDPDLQDSLARDPQASDLGGYLPSDASPEKNADWRSLEKEVLRRALSQARARLGLKENSFDPSLTDPDINSALDSIEKSDIPASLQPEDEVEMNRLKWHLKKSILDSLSNPIETILARATQSTLDQTVVMAHDQDQVVELQSKSSASCITINSSRFSGYLIVAMAEKKPLDQEFLKLVQQKLFEYLRSTGEQLQEDDTLDLQLQEVDFKGWSLAEAQFLRKSVHRQNEVAMAFFPNKIDVPALDQINADDMVQMPLSEVRGGAVVEFDLYLRLEENQKYLLYTPQKMCFLSEQKDRLMKKGIQNLHIHKDSVKFFKKYKAQIFLNDKIQDYYKRQQQQVATT